MPSSHESEQWPEMRNLAGNPPPGYDGDGLEVEGLMPKLRAEVFQSDHVVVGLVATYVFVARFIQGVFSPGGEDGARNTTAAVVPNRTHLLTNCPDAELGIDFAALFGITFVFLVRHYHLVHNRQSCLMLLLKTFFFFAYLGLSFNQPFSCLAYKNYNAFRIAAGVLLLFVLGIPTLLAHIAIPEGPRYGHSKNGSTLQRVITTSTTTNHSDILLAVIHNAIIKFTESEDPTNCTSAHITWAWLSFGVLTVLYFLKHFVRLSPTSRLASHQHSVSLCPPYSIELRGVGRQYVLTAIYRTLLFDIHILTGNPHPLSCIARSASELKTLAYVQSGLSSLLALHATAAHPWHSPLYKGKLIPDPS